MLLAIHYSLLRHGQGSSLLVFRHGREGLGKENMERWLLIVMSSPNLCMVSRVSFRRR